MRKLHLLFLGSTLLLGFAHTAGAEPVKVNCADAAALATGLKGIGDAKAAAIVEYREANGPFKTLEDLGQVKGVGAKTIENNQENIDLTATCA